MRPNVEVRRGKGRFRETLDLSKVSLLRSGATHGLAFEVIAGYPDNIFRAVRGGEGFIFQHWPGYRTRRREPDFEGLVDKERQKAMLLECGVPAPRQLQVVTSISEIDWSCLSYPLVVKPCVGRMSMNVVVDIKSREEVRDAVGAVVGSGQRCLLEEYVRGENYRILCVGGRYVGCVWRRAASVLGDGEHRIRELVAIRSEEAGRRPRGDLLSLTHALVCDEGAVRRLLRNGYELDSIPGEGVRVRLQDKITGELGADFIDMTTELHSETVEMCERFASRHGLFMAGFDFITNEIGKSCRVVGAFNEVNVRDVNTSACEHCNIGTRRAVSDSIWRAVDFERVARSWFPLY